MSIEDTIKQAVAEAIRDGVQQIAGDLVQYPRLMGTAKAASYLGISERTLQNLVAAGTLRPVDLTAHWLFDRHDLDTLIEQRKRNSAA